MIVPMTIILSHTSALDVLRSPRAEAPPCAKPPAHNAREESAIRFETVPNAKAAKLLETTKPLSLELAETMGILYPNGDERRVHHLIPNEAFRSRSRIAAPHTFPHKLPSRALTPVARSLYMTSPSFTFFLLAPTLPICQTVALAYELCGSYRLAAGSFEQHAPLATTAALSTCAAELAHARGASAARRSAKFVMDGSASPMETMLATILSLPCKYGGYGLPTPLLNHRIDLSPNAQRIARKRFVKCDLFWPDGNLCVEYNSNKHHTGAERIDSDARRQAALLDMGVTVITITAGQILNVESCDAAAKAIAKKIGRRIRPQAPWRAAQGKMRRDLLEWHGLRA